VLLAAVGSLAVAAAAEPKEADSKTKSRPKELTVDLGKGIKLEMVLIPAGEFMMGSPDSDKDAQDGEKPQHRVRITRPFYLGKYLVTQEQWEAVMGNNPSIFKGPKNPVDNVSWNDCQVFLGRLNVKPGWHGGKFVLPTEAQWEYACRAGSTTRYCFGDDEKQLGEYAWYNANSSVKTHPVGAKKANAWGIYDMHGNVVEFCQDWYAPYGTQVATDPSGPSTGSGRVSRGSGFGYLASQCRSSARGSVSPGSSFFVFSFRVSQVPADK
jgi:formylglycine-generating enzyme required for sulfatase activity